MRGGGGHFKTPAMEPAIARQLHDKQVQHRWPLTSKLRVIKSEVNQTKTKRYSGLISEDRFLHYHWNKGMHGQACES